MYKRQGIIDIVGGWLTSEVFDILERDFREQLESYKEKVGKEKAESTYRGLVADCLLYTSLIQRCIILLSPTQKCS